MKSTSNNSVKKICLYYGITDFKINHDLSIDVYGDVDLSSCCLEVIPVIFRNIYGNFDVRKNNLSTLKNSPKLVSGNFYCQFNQLESLKHSPLDIGASYFCNNNKLKDLKYCPRIIYGNFICHNNLIETIAGIPIIGNDIDLSYNNLKAIIELNVNCGGEIYIYGNPIENISKEFNFNGAIYGDEYVVETLERNKAINEILNS